MFERFLFQDIVYGMLETHVDVGRGLFSGKFMSAMDGRARIKFMTCIMNVPNRFRSVLQGRAAKKEQEQQDQQDQQDQQEQPEADDDDDDDDDDDGDDQRELGLQVLLARIPKSPEVSRTLLDHDPSVRAC